VLAVEVAAAHEKSRKRYGIFEVSGSTTSSFELRL